MFRHRFSIAPRRGKNTTVVLAASAFLSAGCTGDVAGIVGLGTSSGEPGVASPSGTESGGVGVGDGAPGESASSRVSASPSGDGAASPSGSGTPSGSAAGANDGNVTANGAVAPTATAPPATEGCWQLETVNRARLYAVPGAAAALAGGKIVGSNTSPMNDFVDLAVIGDAPEGQWLELGFANTTPYRYVKYYGPPGSYGAVAEVELYAGEQRLAGAGFGSLGAGEDAVNGFGRALDGDTGTWFEGALPNDNYVGIDAAAGHVASAPTLTPAAGTAPAGASVTLEGEAGATVFYTLDGTDPRNNGTPYTGPVALPPGMTLLRAMATRECAYESEVVQALYDVAGAPVPTTGREEPSPAQRPVQSSLHIGNSLTDTVVEYLAPVALDGGITLDLRRYTIPGAGTWLYDQNPTGGFGEENVQQALLTRSFDHVTMQPFPNLPCQPLPSSDGPDSDSGYVNQAWLDARTQNPDVQLWVYQQWPAPADIVNCITGGAWTRADWQPPAPASWEDAVANELAYDEVVRNELVRLNPGAPEPYIIPAGLALLRLKQAIEAGLVPGIGDFFGALFKAGGDDIHLTSAGAYYVTLVFYACMFQASPEGLVNESNGELTDEQAAVMQRLVWETVTGYPLSGVAR